jgi:hypothetical protein
MKVFGLKMAFVKLSGVAKIKISQILEMISVSCDQKHGWGPFRGPRGAHGHGIQM